MIAADEAATAEVDLLTDRLPRGLHGQGVGHDVPGDEPSVIASGPSVIWLPASVATPV